ncbi:hypothetical protein NYE67_16310 [Solibacillus sp. FSL W8-0474]|uniref:hypothetical protein n=1 Tax=Solibacillus sp. FSL W8-0474 TaxID=2975336 RepID=UPI0030FB7154
MKTKVRLAIIMISVLAIAFGCSMQNDENETEPYHGKPLHIGIIGEEPDVREEQIQFTSIDFTDLQKVENYDAIFITKENLKEADKAQYAKVYNNSTRPFLFIDSQKGYVPFIKEQFDFENYPDVESGVYAYLYDSKSQRYWGYVLSNEVVNEQSIQGVYSRIFETIEDLSGTNSD